MYCTNLQTASKAEILHGGYSVLLRMLDLRQGTLPHVNVAAHAKAFGLVSILDNFLYVISCP
eukprot:m.8249 g.8249  ORF g.8249 m.8249 type:complete len:62 (-) comp3859_c0_seq2:57-242(-)